MFFFYIFMLIVALLVGLIFSSIELHIKNLEFSSSKLEENYFDNTSKIALKLYFYGIIKYFEVDLQKRKLDNQELKRRINKIEKKIQDKKNINIIRMIKYLNIKIKKLNLKVNIDLEDAAFLAILVGIFSCIISNLLPIISKKSSIINWKISPIYKGKNLLNISLNGILKTNLIHIIYTLYMLNKQGGDKVEK